MQEFYSAGYNSQCLMRSGNSELTKIMKMPPNIDNFASGKQYNIFYDRNGNWYGGGENRSNQQGHSNLILQPFTILGGFAGYEPQMITCGDNISAFISKDKSLYVTGSSFGTLCRIPGVPPLSKICASFNEIIGIPENQNGAYVVTHSGSICKYFSKYFENQKIVDCAAENDYFVAVDSNGDAYWWNSVSPSRHSVLVESQAKINIPMKVSKVFANFRKIYFVTNDNAFIFVYDNVRLGNSPQSSGFLMINVNSFTRDPIKQIVSTERITFILDESGSIYTNGHTNPKNLFKNNYSDQITFQKVRTSSNKKFSHITGGSNFVIFAVGCDPFRTCFVPSASRRKQHAPVYRSVLFKSEDRPNMVDVSDSAFAYLGYERGNSIVFNVNTGFAEVVGLLDGIVVVKKLNTNSFIKVKFENPASLHNYFVRVLNYKDAMNGQLIDLLAEKNDSKAIQERMTAIIYNDNKSNIQNGMVLSKGDGSLWVKKLTRSKLALDFNCSDGACRAFGFLSGETVKHELIGSGTVVGVFGCNLWFMWDNDSGLVTNAAMSPVEMHNLIEITNPKDRTVSTFFLEDENSFISIETEPCNILKKYGFEVNDIVQTQNGLGQIFGEFGFKVAVQYTKNNKYDIVLPNTLRLVRRDLSLFDSEHPSRTDPVINLMAFNGKVAEIDVGFDEETDEFIPLDRILTQKGFATVVGKKIGGENERAYWIQTDDAFALNMGVLLMKDLSRAMLLRRFSENDKIVKNLNVSFSLFDNSSILFSGDVLEINCKMILLLGFDEFNDPVFFSMDNGNVIEKDQIDINDNLADHIAFRAGIESTLNFCNKNKIETFAKTNIEYFQGVGFKPGDLIDYPNGEAVILGINKNCVWIKNRSSEYPTAISIADAHSFNVIKRLGVGIKNI